MVGDVVWAPLPFTDLRDEKVRPVLVIADAGDEDWIVCRITTSQARYDRAIVLSRRDMQSGRLRMGSQVRPDRLFTLSERLFQHTIGQVTAAKQAEIAAAVRSLF